MTQLLLPAMLNNFTPKKDGSITIKFDSRELSAEEYLMILGFRNTEGWLQFSQNQDMKAPDIDAELDLKSQSQRLKDALYVYYKDESRVTTFNSFYNENMEKIIQLVLNKVKK